MADKKDSTLKTLSDNRQAFHNYFLLERFECGMVLTGTEVKAAKDGKVQLKEAYASVLEHGSRRRLGRARNPRPARR